MFRWSFNKIWKFELWRFRKRISWGRNQLFRKRKIIWLLYFIISHCYKTKLINKLLNYFSKIKINEIKEDFIINLKEKIEDAYTNRNEVFTILEREKGKNESETKEKSEDIQMNLKSLFYAILLSY